VNIEDAGISRHTVPRFRALLCLAAQYNLRVHTLAAPAHRRDQLERLIRYTGRGAVSLERLAASLL
jgi:Putative transposase